MKNNDLKPSSLTDWAKIDALTDEEIDTSDVAPLDDDFFARAQLIEPENNALTLTLSPQAMKKIKALAKERQTTSDVIVTEWVEERVRISVFTTGINLEGSGHKSYDFMSQMEKLVELSKHFQSGLAEKEKASE